MRDDQVLTLATVSQRVLVWHDVGTMPANYGACRDAGNHSAGVFLIPQSLDIGTAIDEPLLIWVVPEGADRPEWLPL